MRNPPLRLVAISAVCLMAAASAPGASQDSPPAAPAKPATPAHAPADAGAKPLEAGDVAPDFALVGSDGKTYRLADFKGKRAVVIAWFPKAFTGG